MKTFFYRIACMAFGICTLSACSKYDDYMTDYDYSAVYFGSQQPLRTVVARDGHDRMTFRIGAVLGGVLDNGSDQWVTFEIAPDLLPASLTLMPANYYSMDCPDNKIIIPKGKFMGDFAVNLDKSLFGSDPLALGKNYAIPLRLVTTSADSILRGDDVTAAKDYTVIVVKYISSRSGTYYVKGVQNEIDDQDVVIPSTTVTYSVSDLSANRTRSVTTLSLTELGVSGIGGLTTDNFKITVVDGSVSLSVWNASSIEITDRGSSYDAGSATFTLKYIYTKSGKRYTVDEQMIIRQDPELDLRYEEW